MVHRRSCVARRACAASLLILSAGAADVTAGGSPENALILVDPARPDSLRIANHYIAARRIPASNILYIDPTASNYASFVIRNVPAVLDRLSERRIDDHIDYMIAAAPSNFFVSAPGLVADGCSPVNRFSISGAYTLAYQASTVAAGGLGSQRSNQYYIGNATSQAFDSSVGWTGGSPAPGGRRYLIGALLGWTGARGNTAEDILSIIDRSVAVDGTRPTGTFYFEETTDVARSGPRDAAYPGVVSALINAGAQAEHQLAVLPIGRHDCQGIMTGAAVPGIATANLTILPGAFCDHLTSYAAMFDEGSQEKLSAWIARGASASWGQVEEPCNYPGKFPHARIHRHIFNGLSLGEACFRSLGFEPFQGLFYGDPLARPFAVLPTIDVPDAPAGIVAGTVTITPTAATTSPAAIAGIEILADGVVIETSGNGTPVTINTTHLSDGWHDLRALAFDDTLVRSVGRWIGSLTVNNHGRSASCTVNAAVGDLDTEFEFNASATGAGVIELRIVQNGRVLAASNATSAAFGIRGHTLGAGQVVVQAEALLVGDERVRSAPLAIDIAPTSAAPAANPPIVWNYTKYIRPDAASAIELPATYGGSHGLLTYQVLTAPTQATAPTAQAGPARVFIADGDASGVDTLTFRVDSPTGSSSVATVSIRYLNCIGDLNSDAAVNLSDLAMLLANFGVTSGASYSDGDITGDGAVSLTDLSMLLSVFGTVCE